MVNFISIFKQFNASILPHFIHFQSSYLKYNYWPSGPHYQVDFLFYKSNSWILYFLRSGMLENIYA